MWWTYPLSSAFVSVEMAGENKAACMNATMLLGVAEFCCKALAWAVIDVDGSGKECASAESDLDGMLRCHKVLGPARVPDRMMVWSNSMVTLFAVNVAMQPASQSVPIDRSMPSFKAGTMWTSRAGAGKAGMSRSASWVECMMVPFGLVMLMG